MNPRYLAVASRAGHRCEYCHAPEAVFNLPFEVEHVLPPGKGGSHELENLALSCRSCNLFKSDLVVARDTETGHEVSLFHPRLEAWHEHFLLRTDGTIAGTTAAGRATVGALQMNTPAQLRARRMWMQLSLLQPEE